MTEHLLPLLLLLLVGRDHQEIQKREEHQRKKQLRRTTERTHPNPSFLLHLLFSDSRASVVAGARPGVTSGLESLSGKLLEMSRSTRALPRAKPARRKPPRPREQAQPSKSRVSVRPVSRKRWRQWVNLRSMG